MNEQLKKLIIASGVFILAIWTIGPFIAIAGKAPLANISVRLILSFLIILAWAGFGFWHWLNQHKSATTTQRQSASAEPPWLYRFQQQLNASKQRAQQISKHKAWQQQPQWTLILGPNNSGKTSLLKELNCQHITMPDEAKEAVPFQFWINNSEGFLSSDIDLLEQQQDKYGLWSHIIPLIKKQRLHNALRCVVIVIDFPKLCQTDKEQLNQLGQQLCQHLDIIQQVAPKCPIQLVISQCDRILGFKEYFSASKNFDKKRTLGISIRSKRNLTHFDALFHQQRDALIQKINQDILGLIQNQHTPKKRKDMSQLPFQLDLLMLRSKRLFNPLPDTFKKQITDISFCATEQSQQPINITTPFLQAIISPLQPRSSHVEESHVALFVDRAHFAQCIKLRQKTLRINTNLKPIVLPVAAAIVLSTTLATSYYAASQHGYTLTTSTLEKIHSLKNQTIPYTIPNDLSWLSEMQNDQSILAFINNSGARKYQWLGITTINKLYHQIEQRYQLALTAQFEPYAFSMLNNSLLRSKPENATALYTALRTYLMLTEHEHYNKQQVIAWYRLEWKNSHYNQELINLLTQQLTQFLANYNTYWPANPVLLKTPRHTLNTIPASRLAFLKLEMQQFTILATVANPDNSILTADSMKMPVFFTSANRKHIESIKQQDLLTILNAKDWVNPDQAFKLSDKQKASLTKDVLTHYHLVYGIQWKKLLNNLEFKTPTDLSQLNNMIGNLKNPDSNFYQQLNMINDNASQGQKQTTQSPSSYTANLTTFLANPSVQQPWQKTLGTLQTITQQMLNSTDSNQAAYTYTAEKLRKKQQEAIVQTLIKQTNTAPPPIQKGLKAITQSYWTVMFSSSHKYIDSQWQNSVKPLYQAGIQNKFPIFSNARSDITTADFNAFFAPKGAVDTFFNNYLAPFVNTKGYYWTWKKIDGKSMDIPQATLDMIIRASIIQQMFYSNNVTTPSQQFALTLKNMSDNISSIAFNIEGQTINFKPGQTDLHTLQTPGTKPEAVSLTFYGTHGKYSLNTKGPWAWLRLVQRGNIKTTSDTNQFLLNFTTTHYTATLGLVAQNKVNPYLPGVLSAFRCPDNL